VTDVNLFELRKENELLKENLSEMSVETIGMIDTIVMRGMKGVKGMVGHFNLIEPIPVIKIQPRRTDAILIAPAMIVTTAVGVIVVIDTMCVNFYGFNQFWF
jgi:hypothetical protein